MASTSAASSSGPDGDSQQQQPREQLVLSLSGHLGPQGSNDSDIHLILASQSPRRREILDMMGLQGKFTVTPSPLNESELQTRLSKEAPVDYTRLLAEEKARALALDIIISNTATALNRPTLVLGSDTIVDLDGKTLEKPMDEADAKQMLRRLSGRQHSVHTGVAVYLVLPKTSSSSTSGRGSTSKQGADAVSSSSSPILLESFTDTARVCFAELSEVDIDSYIATKEPMDKAGSYGIQGIGGQFVSNVDGDFFTVMGLPMRRTSLLLARSVLSNVISNVIHKI